MARAFTHVRTGTAQATTGQTDTVAVPGYASTAIVYLRVSAAAGTTPLTDMKFQYVNPITSTALDFQWNGITQIAGTTGGHVVAVIGKGYDTEDDTGPVYFVKDPLPGKFNIVLTFDRADADETYTYTLGVEFIE